MANKERDFGQKGQQGGQQQDMDKDRSDRESGKPLQLDDEKQQKQGQQHQGGQHQQGGQEQRRPQQGGGEHANR